uniref:Uncharacterized protein n=1 Tax=Zea mays TaxID=4577 RepID=A0A804R2L8_MAIZE
METEIESAATFGSPIFFARSVQRVSGNVVSIEARAPRTLRDRRRHSHSGGRRQQLLPCYLSSRAFGVLGHDTLEATDQIQQVAVRRPALLHGRSRLDRERAGPPPPLICLLPGAHQAPHGLLHHVPADHNLLLYLPVHERLRNTDADADAQHLHGHLLVQELVREVRPRDYRQPRGDGLDRGVPAAVRHEPAHRGVGQDQHLRRPPPDEQAAPRDARLEVVQEGAHGPVVLVDALDHPDERVPRRFQPEAELHGLPRVRLRDAPEADVHDGAGLLAVEPPEARVDVDVGSPPSRRQRPGALVVQRHRPDRPDLHPPGRRVAGHVLGLHLLEGVHDDAVGLGPRALHVVREVLPPGHLAEEARGLRPRDQDPSLQPRHDDRLVVVGDAPVRAEPLHVVLAQKAEGAHAEEAEARDPEVGRQHRGPRVAEVRHEARRVGARVRAEVGLDRRAQERDGVEVAPRVLRRDVVHVVGAFGQAGPGVVQRELEEADRQARLPGGLDGRAHPRGRGRGPDHGADRAVRGE